MIIAVWGSNGSGKTTLAVNLSTQIAKKYFTLAIGGALTHSSLQHYFGLAQTRSSLLKSLQNPNYINNNLIEYRKYKNLYILDNDVRDDCLLCTDITDQQAQEMLSSVVNQFEVIVVDCSVNYNNVLTRAALIQSDTILYLVNPVLESFSYVLSHNDLMTRLRVSDKIKYVLNNDKKLISKKIIESKLQVKFDIVLPWCRGVENTALNGIPIDVKGAQNKRENNYLKQLVKLESSLLGINKNNGQTKYQGGTIFNISRRGER